MSIKLPAAYTAAQRALATLVKIEQASKVASVAGAMEVLAVKAKDPKLAGDAAELKVRSTRKIGSLIKIEKAEGKQAKGTRGAGNPKMLGGIPKSRLAEKTLASRGVDKNLAIRARKLEAMPEGKFEKHVTKVKRIATAAAEGDTAILKAWREEQFQEKLAARAAREAALAAKIRALPEKRYGVIYADPEWLFKTFSVEGTRGSVPEDHYSTSELEVIKARGVESIAADDCVLFLWATQPMLPQAQEVMAAWGFDYKSHCIWNKDKTGTGYWFVNKHEVLLVGTRGKIPAPALGTQFPSVIDAPRGGHSEKPTIFYKVIEKYFPTLPKIELNARKKRKGWDNWGTEDPEEMAEAAE